MANMAFFIPLNRLSVEYKERIQTCAPETLSFVHHYNAELRIYNLLESDCQKTNGVLFYFNSQDAHCKPVRRPVCLYPNLVKFRIGNNGIHYSLMLLAEINKIFRYATENNENLKYCTPHDLIYLKKAFYDDEGCNFNTSPENLLENNLSFGNWIDELICRLVGPIFLPYSDKTVIASIVKILVQDICIDGITSEETLSEAFNNAYLEQNQKVEKFLSSSNNFDSIKNMNKVSDMEKFVYGLLYTNDNFLQLHDRCVKQKIDEFYSNNYSEQYWAVHNNIVSIHTGYPYRWDKDNRPSVRYNVDSHLFHNCIPDICTLLMLDECIKYFKYNEKMRSHEIERQRSYILKYFNETVYDVLELDERLHFFMRSFGIRDKFDEVQNVMAPRRNAMESVFTMTSAIIGWLIGLITCLIALIDKF